MSQSLSARDGGASGSHLGDETLSAYLDGELDTHEVPPAASHLERCPSCRERLGSLSRAAESVGRPVRPVASSTRQLQLERALGGSTRLHLRDSVGRNRRRLVVARWAAALVMVAGGSASLWHFRSDLSGRSGPTASQTSARAAREKALPPALGNLPVAVAPALQLRALLGLPYTGCAPPLARTAPPRSGTLYDASASASSGAPRCARISAPLASIDRASGARVLGGAAGPLVSLVLSVPASSVRSARSLLLGHADLPVAVVVGDEVVGYLSAVQASGGITIARVPATVARELAAEIMGS